MKKTCFLITPIGKPNSPIRKRVDQWEYLVYQPAFGEEFKIIRADKIAATGIITDQILDLIVHAELAIIDFTDLNANVMYEAAIRHASKKQFIQICPTTTDLPFDIQGWRVNYYDPEDLEYPHKLVEKLKACYKEMQDSDYKVPELLPVKFDLENIVRDPQKFVDILKEKLIFSKGEIIVGFMDNISEVYESPLAQVSPAAVSSAALGTWSKRVKCPKCGALQTFTTSPYDVDLRTAFVGNKHYLCNICGTEFE